MSSLRSAFLATPIALLAACAGPGDPGGGSSSGTGSTALVAAAPQYATLAMDMTTSDVAAGPMMGVADAAGGLMAPAPAPMATDLDPCHPHLLLRTGAVVARVNRHLYKFLGEAEAVMAANPTLATDASVTWERNRNGVDVKFTVTRTGDATFAWKLELTPTGATSSTTVFTGSIDRTGATRPHQGSGEMTLDLTALHAVLPHEPASGTITATFAVTDASRKLVVDAADVAWDVRGESAGLLVQRPPRNAHYVYYREPGKGGSVKITDDMPFACFAIPSLPAADVLLVSRWYRLPSGSVHGRTDAVVTGGLIPADNRIYGVTCHESATESGDPAERFWLLKGEDGTGATWPQLALSAGSGLTPCDDRFGPVPSLQDGADDYVFTPAFFASDDPAPFPTP